jgi:hypothetical protein
MSFRSHVFSALAFTVALAGCSGARHLSPQIGGSMLDTPKSVSPGSITPAPMAHTAILPASLMDVKPQSAILGASWTQIPGAASYAAAAPDGSLWVLSTAPTGPDKYIWHYVSGTWTNISGLATRLSVAPNGTLFAINSGGGTFSYSGGTWTVLGGGASDITAASDGSIYVLSNGNSAGSDQAIWHYTTSWTQVAGSGVRIATSWDPNSFVLSNGTVSPGGLYILNSIGSIYYENANNSFVQLPGSASAIAPTTIGGVFVLGYPTNSSGNVIYYFDLNAQGWSAQSGAGVSISTDSTKLYAIGSSGGIYSSPVTSTSATISGYYLMAFKACNPCGNPLNDTTYLAQSSDGTTWSAIPGYVPYSGSVPGIVRRGKTIYMYTPGFLRRYHIDTNVYDSPVSVTVMGTTNGFVDPDPIIDASGNIVLFYLPGLQGGDPAACPTGQSTCTHVIDSATEAAGSDGASFTRDAGDRATLTLSSGGSGNLSMTASDPDVFAGPTGFVLYVSRGPSVEALSASMLQGTYSDISGLAGGMLVNGAGGVPTGHYFSSTGQFWTYISATDNTIKLAVTTSLGTAIPSTSFSTVLSGATFPGLGGSTVGSPDFALNSP